MKVKIKSCSCKACKAGKAKHRKEDFLVSRLTNKIIRQENKKVVREKLEKDNDYEIDLGRFQGYYFD